MCQGQLSLSDILLHLHTPGIRSVMVEGGASIITSFLESAYLADMSSEIPMLVDSLIITVAPTLVGQQGVPYAIAQVQSSSKSGVLES